MLQELQKKNKNYIGLRVRNGYMVLTVGLRRKMKVDKASHNLRVYYGGDEIGLKVDPEGPFKMTHALSNQGTVSLGGLGVPDGKYFLVRVDDDLFITKNHAI